MNAAALCTTLQQAVPPLFVCSPAPQQGVRVRTPMLYPDGSVVDVFVLERSDGFLVTDFGDALDWLGLQSVSRRRSPKQEALIQDVCQTLRIERFRDQLLLREVTSGALGESVLTGRPGGCSRLGSLVHASQPGGPDGCRRGGRMAQRP